MREGVGDLSVPDSLVRDAIAGSTDLIAVSRRHKLIEPTARAAAALNADVRTCRQFANAAHRDTMGAMRAAGCTAWASELLEQAGCRPVMVKGVPLAVQTTNRLESRGVGDVDVLVEPAALERAISVMLQVGGRARPTVPTLRHAVPIDWRGTTIDIHLRAAHAASLTLPDHSSLWERSVPVDLGGTTVRTLRPIDAAVHISVNSAHDSWSQLIRVADLARLLHLLDSDPDSETPGEVARAWGASAQWALGLAMVRRLRSDIPRQNALAEALATRAWLWLAAGRQLRLSTDLWDKASRDLYRVASAASPAYTRWWLSQSLRRFRPIGVT